MNFLNRSYVFCIKRLEQQNDFFTDILIFHYSGPRETFLNTCFSGLITGYGEFHEQSR
jgi:hypothetical protein